MNNADMFKRLERLIAIGIELSGHREIGAVLTRILESAQALTNADGGTLYMVRDGHLVFEIVRNETLNVRMGGTDCEPLTWPAIPLLDEQGEPNMHMVSTAAANGRRTINIQDAYASDQGFNFSGTRRFDEMNHYRSKSFLTVPMINHEGDVIGVLQLINAKDEATGELLSFTDTDQYLVESLASQAAVVLNNRQLIDHLERLFVSFIKLINTALDEKSPYTHGHCQRVPVLTLQLAEAVSKTEDGPLAGFKMSPSDLYELEIAALMHDCGKITTPVHIVDKSTKLEKIWDRIQHVDARFEVVKRDARIRILEEVLKSGDGHSMAAVEARVAEAVERINADREFLRISNVGGEFMSPEKQARVREIGTRYRWVNPDGVDAPLLDEEEIEKLCIPRGTLNAEEREIINHHIVATIRMLEQLPWPKHMRRVTEFAGGHHERMDGKGYPKGLTREQMSVPARIMAIADVFEALTAGDRPYKSGKTLTESLTILGRMKQDQHIDPDLFDIFVRDKIYLKYAKEYLNAAQIDEVDESRIPGYIPPNPTFLAQA